MKYFIFVFFVGTILTISIDMNQKLPAEVQERFQAIKKKVLDAIAAHHTFMIYGKARVVRECMIQRGWCEKFYRKSGMSFFLQ